MTAQSSADDKVGLAVVDQTHIIPLTGDRVITTRREYWSYCVYYMGGIGIGVLNFSTAALQLVLVQAFPDGTLQWGGGEKSVDSYLLDINGISFAVQMALLVVLGPFADYGSWRPWILIVWTIVSWGVGFGWLAVASKDNWTAASALYVIGFFALNIATTYYSAAFPQIVRDLPKMVELERAVIEGSKDPHELEESDMMERSKLSNVSFMFSCAGAVISLSIALAIVHSIGYNTDAKQLKSFTVIMGFLTAVWVVSAVPYFLWKQQRPGQKLPNGSKWYFVGAQQIWRTARMAIQLKQTFIWLIAYFLLNDVLNTSGTIVQLLQNQVIEFDPYVFTQIFIVTYVAEGVGFVLVHAIQKWFRIPVKVMLLIPTSGILAVNIWGLAGIWTNKIGYKHEWEFWVFQAWAGLTWAGWYSYSQTMISEVVPLPKTYLFFSLFNVVGKTSSFVGPFITAAIIDKANGNKSVAFWFLVPTCITGMVVMMLTNVSRAKLDSAAFLRREAGDLYQTEHPAGTHVQAVHHFTDIEKEDGGK